MQIKKLANVTKKYFVIILIIIALLLPILFYYLKFRDNGISADPNDWASFGSYLSGIYGFFGVFATLYLVSKQIDLQNKQLELQNEQNTFQEKLIYVQEAKEGIDYYLDEIKKLFLKEIIIDELTRQTIINSIKININAERKITIQSIIYIIYKTREYENKDEVKALFPYFIKKIPIRSLYKVWNEIYIILENLKNKDDIIYNNNYIALSNKINSTLADHCIRLDYFHKLVHTIRTKKSKKSKQYIFNKTLNENTNS